MVAHEQPPRRRLQLLVSLGLLLGGNPPFWRFIGRLGDIEFLWGHAMPALRFLQNWAWVIGMAGLVWLFIERRFRPFMSRGATAGQSVGPKQDPTITPTRDRASKEAEIVADEAKATRERAVRHDVRDRIGRVTRLLIGSHEALDKAFRASVSRVRQDAALLREVERLLEARIGNGYAQVGALQVAVNRSMQDAPESDKPSSASLVEMMVACLADHINFCWALENFRLLPDVLLARPPEITRWQDAVERLKAELRPLVHHSAFDIRPIAAHLEPIAIPDHAPRVVPSRWGHLLATSTGSDQGLLVENLGGPARRVVADPIPLGRRWVRFEGPKIPELKQGDPPALYPAHVEESPGHLHRGLLKPFREWQTELGDPARETVGKVYYDDFDGNRYVTFYRLGVDVLNRDSGMAVGFLEQRRLP